VAPNDPTSEEILRLVVEYPLNAVKARAQIPEIQAGRPAPPSNQIQTDRDPGLLPKLSTFRMLPDSSFKPKGGFLERKS
jgi:hypothetical protein